MFTGIVEDVGRVREVTEDEGGRRLRIETDLGPFREGQSVAVAGACLTVERADAGRFEVFTAAETLAKTSLGGLAAGDRVNLERAMAADGRFDGHVVQGHVDGTTEVTAVETVGEDRVVTFAVPDGLGRYLVPKGSITLDGVSLTIAALDDDAGTFDVALIPETLTRTTFGEAAPGDTVNVEVDVLAKYVERLLAERDGLAG